MTTLATGPVLTAVGPDDHEMPELVQSLEQQLVALYEEKGELQAALGVSTSAEIIALLAAPADDMVASLTDQLTALYAERDELQTALGCSSSTEVVAVVGELTASVRTLVGDARRRLHTESVLLDTHERFLA